MKKLLKTLKGKIILGAAAVAVVAAAVAVVVVVLPGDKNKEESYRTIVVDDLHGKTVVSGTGKDTVDAYKGQHLYGGDDVAVQKESDMTMLLDMDKYVYARENTCFSLESKGKEPTYQTVIHLEDGSVLNRIKNNLNAGEEFKVDTPNATLAVRGTVFRVTQYKGADGYLYVLLEVFEGQVYVELQTNDGVFNGVNRTFVAGESVLIRGNDEVSEFVLGEDNKEAGSIDYKALPQDVATVLVSYIDDGETLCIGKELLMDYTGLAEHKMETTKKEATCTEDGELHTWCSVCNEVTELTVIPATGHEVGEFTTVTEADCETEGKQQKVCSKCQAVCEEQTIAALGHLKGAYEVIKAADCTNAGEKVAYCERCNKVVDTVTIKALGHKASDWQTVSEATCTADGAKQKVCTVCGEVLESSTIAATGHSMGEWYVVSAATCQANGSSQRACLICGLTENRVETNGTHAWTAWTVNYDATCYQTGSRTRGCSICGFQDTQDIPILSHTYNNPDEPSYHDYGEINPATGFPSELTCTRFCDMCGEAPQIVENVPVIFDAEGIPRCGNCNNIVAH